MNDRMRQIYKVQLKMMKDTVMAVITCYGKSGKSKWYELIFIHKDQIDEYKQRYGDDIKIWG